MVGCALPSPRREARRDNLTYRGYLPKRRVVATARSRIIINENGRSGRVACIATRAERPFSILYRTRGLPGAARSL